MRIHTIVALGLLGFGAASGAGAQVRSGAIEGVAHAAEDGSPLSFALIHLVAVDQQTAVPQKVLTDAVGRFRLDSVPSGDYRLVVERIGYERDVSRLVHVGVGETVRHDIRGATSAVRLPSVTVRPGTSCLTAAQLPEAPEVAVVWNEVRKGVEGRRAFELQYRFSRVLRQDIRIGRRFRSDKPLVRQDTFVSEPDSVLIRDQRFQARNREQGYARGNSLRMPDEKEIFGDDFLRDHCLEPTVQRADNALGLRFRPVTPRQSGTNIRGTVWVEGDTYLIRRLDIEYVDGDRVRAEATIDYADIAVAGGALRLPSGGGGVLHPRGAMRTMYTGADAKLTYTYAGFQQVRFQ